MRRLVHIPLGSLLLAIAFASCAYSWCCSLNAATLPYYTKGGATTDFVQFNPTDAPLPFTDDNLIYSPRPSTIPAHGWFISPIDKAGIGVYHVSPSDGVIVFSRIVMPSGAVVFQGDLPAVDAAHLTFFAPLGKYNTGVFVAAALHPTVVTAVESAQAANLSTDEGAILSTPLDKVTLLAQLGGKFYVFGFINHWVSGSIQVVPAYPY